MTNDQCPACLLAQKIRKEDLGDVPAVLVRALAHHGNTQGRFKALSTERQLKVVSDVLHSLLSRRPEDGGAPMDEVHRADESVRLHGD